MTALGDAIKRIIAHEGPISVERYMALALYDERHGYYMTRDPFGEAGDFTTAPEISQMFGELIGAWVASTARYLPLHGTIRLVELGPGRGTLMADALRVLKLVPELRARLAVHLVETSPVLRAKQEAALRDSGVPMAWHQRHDEVPEGPAIFIANEFFDALPIRQFARTERGWCERLIGLDANGALIFGLAADPETKVKAQGPLGSVAEVSPAGVKVICELAARFARSPGAALIIDYGRRRGGRGDTLQAMKRHAYANPLKEPGEVDLTTHVDFGALAYAALVFGAAVHGPVTQQWFLDIAGIYERAKRLKENADRRQQADIDAALDRLRGRYKGQMGYHFKVMAIAHPAMPALVFCEKRLPPNEATTSNAASSP